MSAPAAPAPAAPAPAPAAAEGAPSTETETTITPQAGDAGAEGETTETTSEGGAEGAEGGEQEGGEPPPEAPPPRLAAAKRMLAKAEAKEAAAAAAMADAEAYKARLKEVGERWGEELSFARSIREAAKASPLKAAKMLGLDVSRLAQELVSGGDDDDDRPLTRKELLRLQREQEEAAEKKAAEKRTQDEQAAAQAKRQQETVFLGHLKHGAGAASELIKALGEVGESVVIKEAYAAKAALDAGGAPYKLAQLLDDTNKRCGERLAALRGAPTAAPAAPPGAPPAKPGAKPPVGLSNRTAATKAGAKPKSKDELWDKAFEELGTVGRRPAA